MTATLQFTDEHQSRNEALLRQLRANGVPIDCLHLIDHHFWTPSHESATSLQAALKSIGLWNVTVRQQPGAEAAALWNVEGQIQRTLVDAASESVTRQLVRIAALHRATYDGWGASIDAPQ